MLSRYCCSSMFQNLPTISKYCDLGSSMSQNLPTISTSAS
jgi:hypothetical protein